MARFTGIWLVGLCLAATVARGESYVQVAMGYDHACAVTTLGGVRCWGRNASGQLGDGTTTERATPVDVKGLATPILSVAVGGAHTCAVTVIGEARCWG